MLRFDLKNIVLCLSLTVFLSACGQKSNDTHIIKIGSASPLTGAQAHIGIDIRNGVELAIEAVNQTGLRLADKPVKLELAAEDDEANATKATTVAQKLVDAKVVGVVGHFNSGASIPASKIYADAGIPQISPASTNPDYTLKGYKTTFRVVAHDGQQGPALAHFALDQLHAHAIAIIDDSTSYGQGLADNFEATVTAAGAKVVAREHTTDKDTDFKAILTKIKGKNADLIMFGGIDPQAGPMKKQMVELGIKAALMGGDGMQTPNFIKLAGSAAEGSFASIPGLPKEKMPGGPAFLTQYQAKYKTEVQLFAPMGYDAVMVLVEAMKRANSSDPAKYLPEIKKTQYQGIIGPIAFDEKGDLVNGPITIYQVKGGQWVALENSKSPVPETNPTPAASPDKSKK
jgi:branched-chain amino acid transport system substrate-binding protein